MKVAEFRKLNRGDFVQVESRVTRMRGLPFPRWETRQTGFFSRIGRVRYMYNDYGGHHESLVLDFQDEDGNWVSDWSMRWYPEMLVGSEAPVMPQPLVNIETENDDFLFGWGG